MPGLEDYMRIVEENHEKTASKKTDKVDSNLLMKLAAELEKDEAPAPAVAEEQGGQFQVVPTNAAAQAAGAASAAADAQGGVLPANSTVTGADAAVAGASAAVEAQAVAAGQNPAEVAAGEVPAPVKPNEDVIISAGDGKATDANNISKEPAAVAAAVVNDSEEGTEKTAELKRAEEIGAAMAQSYVKELEKIAQDNQYQEALGFLNERGVLEGYSIKDQG